MEVELFGKAYSYGFEKKFCYPVLAISGKYDGSIHHDLSISVVDVIELLKPRCFFGFLGLNHPKGIRKSGHLQFHVSRYFCLVCRDAVLRHFVR